MNETRRVFVLLPGKKEEGDHYQLLQEEVARQTGDRLGLRTSIEYAPSFDQLRVLKKALLAEEHFDAVVTEPSKVSAMDFMLRELRGRVGLVLLNAWSPSVEECARSWGDGLPFGTVSTNHGSLGQIQGEQVRALLPDGGVVLCVTGPRRSSAAQERLDGLRATVGPEVELTDTEAGHWTEAAGITAFDDWYRVAKSRNPAVKLVAAQSDELAIGVRDAIEGVPDAGHREALREAKLLGMDACPGYGQKLVDEGVLRASVFAPANTGLALELLDRFWKLGQSLPLRSFTEARAYPSQSAG